MSDLIYIDAQGDKQALDLSLDLYREAADRGQSLKQYMANAFPTNSDKHGSAERWQKTQ